MHALGALRAMGRTCRWRREREQAAYAPPFCTLNSAFRISPGGLMKLKRILVPYDGDSPSEEMLRLACLVAKSARGHGIPLSGVPPVDRRQAQSRPTTMSTRAVLERAEKVGALYGVEVNGLALQSSDAM